MLPITEIVRLHALAHRVAAVNTNERLEALAILENSVNSAGASSSRGAAPPHGAGRSLALAGTIALALRSTIFH